MKAILLTFDSLNRHLLPPYGCDWVQAPNFARLAQRSVTFDNAYVGSMPCMPARRELHTGRYNFLHRSWGPLEPFDDSMPALLRDAGIASHLISDHYHYWEDGGANYHTRYTSWECVRGQEGDPWKCNLRNDVPMPEETLNLGGKMSARRRQDFVNRSYMRREQDHYQARTFGLGLEFLETNHAADNWFLHLETFDPHEPYFSSKRFESLYRDLYRGPHFDWPPYGRARFPPEAGEHLRLLNAALVSMCDHHLGLVLDRMDALDLWKDTLLIVNTDHGFLLGEHDWWAKCVMPFYNEVAHMPLFVWDPRVGHAGERRRSLVQTIDIAPTLLEYFALPRPPDMQGLPLRETLASDAPLRTAGLFGLHGAQVNCTDGRYVYMRAPTRPENAPLFNYTLMPAHMRDRFPVDELADIRLQEPFAFTKGCRTMKTAARPWVNPHAFGTLLFDLARDPRQERPIQDEAVEQRMVEHMTRLMRANDAPVEQYERLGLPLPA
jgi:arylsulfatase A-like enzyme